jgi:hypothetical protein
MAHLGDRRVRTPKQVQESLREQLEMLSHACEGFDAGRMVLGKQIATVLRTVLYAPAHRGNRRTLPLLLQAGLAQAYFFETSVSIETGQYAVFTGPTGPPSNKVPVCALAGVRFGREKAAFFAPLDSIRGRWTSYPNWLNRIILRDRYLHTATRLDLIKLIADTDGGAHVDAAIPSHFADWKDGVSLGWHYIAADGTKTYLQQIELHTMRQLAHEILRTFSRAAPWAGVTYPEVVLPDLAKDATLSPGIVVVGGTQITLDGSQLILSSDA